jgi:hypothetical protein
MQTQRKGVTRQGQIYRFTIDGTDYAAFIWLAGKQFCGRVEGHPQVPHQTANSALTVRAALQAWLTKHGMATRTVS